MSDDLRRLVDEPKGSLRGVDEGMDRLEDTQNETALTMQKAVFLV